MQHFLGTREIGTATYLQQIKGCREDKERTAQVGDEAVVGGEQLWRQRQLGRVGDEHLRLVLHCGRPQRSARVEEALVHHVHLPRQVRRSHFSKRTTLTPCSDSFTSHATVNRPDGPRR